MSKTIFSIFILFVFTGNLSAMDRYIEFYKDKYMAYEITGNKLVADDMNIDAQVTYLGSLWKLFTYAYIKEQSLSVSPYLCKGKNLEEIFCCEERGNIDADKALAKSCGLFFDMERLSISSQSWEKFWRSRGIVHPWLIKLSEFSAEKQVRVKELIDALHSMQKLSRAWSLLNVSLFDSLIDGTAHGHISTFGSMARFKTFTWNHPEQKKEFVGGILGWTKNGRFFWASGIGKSSEFIERTAVALSDFWKERIGPSSSDCITVRFFHDYKIKQVQSKDGLEVVKNGTLNGLYDVIFQNGKRVTINNKGELFVRTSSDQTLIDGMFSVSDYIARVIDREANAKNKNAAEALGIVARTYLYQRAKNINKCLHVIDSSKFQRVSPSTPTKQARTISYKTDELVLKDVSTVNYHLQKKQKNHFSWLDAVELDKRGIDSEGILKFFFNGARIALRNTKLTEVCKINSIASSWLKNQYKKWHRFLGSHQGYENPGEVVLCHLDSGNPYVDYEKKRIYVKWFGTTESQISVAHEYVHLAFKNHPNGQSEFFADELAKKMLFRR